MSSKYDKIDKEEFQELLKEVREIKNKDLSNIDFQGLGINIAGIRFEQCIFSKPLITNQGIGAISGPDFNNMNLEGSQFIRCELREANFIGANTENAIFENCDTKNVIWNHYDNKEKVVKGNRRMVKDFLSKLLGDHHDSFQNNIDNNNNVQSGPNNNSNQDLQQAQNLQASAEYVGKILSTDNNGQERISQKLLHRASQKSGIFRR